MKNQIEKNMVQRHQNMVQKHLDQEEIEDIEDFDEMESYNENSLQVGSECSVRETVAESAPIFQKSSCLNEQSQTIKRNVDFINEFDLQDELPEILKFLRSGNLEITMQKLKNVLQYESLPASERIKYKNQVNFLRFKFKQKRAELKTQIANDVLLVLNEYQLLNFRSELRHKYLKEFQQFLLDQSKLEISKALQIISRQKMICSSFNLNRDLKINNLSQINDLRLRLSSNLIYDLNNYASPLFQLQNQLFNWLYQCNSKIEKILEQTNFFNLQNYEYLQLMKFKRRKIFSDMIDDLSIERDMLENHSLPQNQIMSNNNLFCNSKRFI